MKLTKYILTLLIINYTLLITNCFSQQWRVFTTSNSPLPDNFVRCIAIDTNSIKWIGTFKGIAKLDGNSWIIYDTTNTPLKEQRITTIAVDKNNIIWVGSILGGGLAKFDGINWTIYNTTNSGLGSNSISSISIDNNNVKWIGTSGGLNKYNDTTWILYRTTNSGMPINLVQTLAIENHIKWIGHETLMNNAGLTKYNDTNWVIYTSTNSGLPTNILKSINIDNFGNKWIATQAGGLAKFNSIQNLWTVYNTGNSGLPENNIQIVSIDKNNKKFIGMFSLGIVVYNDTNWINYNPSNSPLPDGNGYRIEVDSNNNKWIGTGGGLAVFNETGIIGIISNSELIPKQFLLYQNYPNPFNPVTTIKYDIPKDGFISLRVYDVLGREVFSVNEFKKAGSHETVFDGLGFASGVYFYSLESNGLKQTKKMLLVK